MNAKNQTNVQEPPTKVELDEMNRKLKIISGKLECTDHLLVHLMARRIKLALEVAVAKHPNASPTVRLDKEDERLGDVMKWAENEGINGNFPRALLYMIIGESCKVQADYRDHLPYRQETDNSLPKLRENLLTLTEKWAPIYDAHYADGSAIKKIHLDFEYAAILQMIEDIPQHERGLLVDIGCATGRETFKHSHSFRRSIGYDVSPHMIERAKANALARGGRDSKIEFHVHDVEQGIPLGDASVSCLYMNHGTASDIPNIKQLLLEVRRTLKPGGLFLLSFYNSDALMYQTFLPWPPVLGAEVDKDEHHIEVACNGKILSVYAKPYSIAETEALLPTHMTRLNTMTHPTIGSILPKDMFEGKGEANGLEAIRSMDADLSRGNLGAYVILTGKKV
jgi:SAM-dependent methyltransferase